MPATRKITLLQPKNLPQNVFHLTLDRDGTITEFRGIQRDGICPVGLNIFSALSKPDSKNLALAVENLMPGMEVKLKYTVPIYCNPKYVTASVFRINDDTFIREKEVDKGEWETFTETNAAREPPIEEIKVAGSSR